ncbi:MAG: FAD-dependent oxidoreductase [Candidatus Competibacterales bacterium]
MQLRASNIAKLDGGSFDVLVIGGGINGAVSAAALAGRGAKVALIDKGDFASFTSMHSSNLAWGGIKYLETYDFALVRKLCLCRNQLMKSYPSTVREIRFLATIERGFRFSPTYLWLGGWLYWFIGNGFTKIPRLLSAAQINRDESIINTDNSVGGFEYSDAYLYDNDARFVFNFVRTATDHGCIAANYVAATDVKRDAQGWAVKANDGMDGREINLHAKVLVNAAGPFADHLNRLSDLKADHEHVFSKGIHLIVERLSPHRRVLAFFADDGRLFFVIPMGARTCIGTTDTRVESPESFVTDEDVDFVLANINKRLTLAKPITRDDIIAYRCGVRPLVVKKQQGQKRDFLKLSRKHAVDASIPDKYLTIFGGKLTDCINVGDEVCDFVTRMGIALPHRKYPWFGEPHPSVRREFFHQAELMDLDSLTAPTSTEPLSQRYWRRYGHEALHLLDAIREDPRQAELLIEGTEYTRCELYQKARREMITKLEDFLRRRSKIALVVPRAVIQNAPGLVEACRILFGDQAQAKFDEYFQDQAVADGSTGESAPASPTPTPA